MVGSGEGGGRPGVNRAVFLDRDGVLVVPEFRDGRSFAPRRLEDFRIYPEAAACLARLKAVGYRLVVVTNQPDVGNGLTPRAVVEEMHGRLREALPLDDVKTCFHGQNEACGCRKPSPALLLEAAREQDIDPTQSFMVGDRASDVEAGRAAGCTTVFIDLGYTEPLPTGAATRVRSLVRAVDAILQLTDLARKTSTTKGDGT